jgi:hypothetical protein
MGVWAQLKIKELDSKSRLGLENAVPVWSPANDHS